MPSNIKQATINPDVDTILEKQNLELSVVIQEILSQRLSSKIKPLRVSRRRIDAPVIRLNARLLGWHESLLPGHRWDRWGSRSDFVQPSIAALQ